MVKVIFVQHDDRTDTLDLEDGISLMEGAVKGGVSGIDADCGGACACATCHVYVQDAWIDRVGSPSVMEENMLEAAACDVKPGSRLSCQITLRPELDGLIVRIPEFQR